MSLDEWTQIESIIQSADTQFLKKNLMSPHQIFDLTRTVEREEPVDFLTDKPHSLYEAGQMIEALRAELKNRPAAAAVITPAPATPTFVHPSLQAIQPPTAPKPAVQLPAPPAAKPIHPSGSTSIADIGRNPMVVRPENPVTEIDHLRAKLNQASTEEEKHALYRQIKEAEAQQRGPRPRARLRGA